MGGQKTVPESVLAEIQSIQASSDKKALQALLGTFGLWRSCISGFSILGASLEFAEEKCSMELGTKSS